MPGRHHHQPHRHGDRLRRLAERCIVSYSDVVSNSCGGSKVISRLWTATDACGNATNALQIITVRDTTRPSITRPADVVLECPADISPAKNGTATGVDACGSVTVTYSDSVSNGCGGTKIISRLWTAVDACGNSTNALQKITVRDTTPPAIVCPASVIAGLPRRYHHREERHRHGPGCLRRRGDHLPIATASAMAAAAARSSPGCGPPPTLAATPPMRCRPLPCRIRLRLL